MKTFKEYIEAREEILNESVVTKVAKIIGAFVLGGFLAATTQNALNTSLDYLQKKQIAEAAANRVERQIEEKWEEEEPIYTDGLIRDTSDYIANEIKEKEKRSGFETLYKGRLGDKIGLNLGNAIYTRINNIFKYYRVARDLKMYKDGIPNKNIDKLLQQAEEQKSNFKGVINKSIDTVKDPKVRKSAADLIRKKGSYLINKGKEIKNRNFH